jgi:hypothetical protein
VRGRARRGGRGPGGGPGARQGLGVELHDGGDAQVPEGGGVEGGVEHPLPAAVGPARARARVRGRRGARARGGSGAHQRGPGGRSRVGVLNARRRPGATKCMSPCWAESYCTEV